jgi:hypothetical protein
MYVLHRPVESTAEGCHLRLCFEGLLRATKQTLEKCIDIA